MQIENDRVVRFHYVLRDGTGKALENSVGGEPMAYLHGRGNLIPGLERQLAGRAAGERVTAVVPPEEGYGLRNDAAVQRIPMKAVMDRGAGKLKPGQLIHVSTEHGPRPVRVVKAGMFMVDVDSNHPLAGETLTFEVEIVEVREATEEERAHGHVHGAGGHHD